MSTKYASQALRALAALTRKGAAVTFTRAVPAAYDATTDVTTPGAPTTVSGYAIRVKGNPDTYLRLTLIESSSPTLLFAPTTPGAAPKEGDTCTWAGNDFTARDVQPIAPDGTGLVFRVVVSR